jgi:hypothetical protein
MLTRAYLLAVLAVVAVTPCHSGKPPERDGSTPKKAIQLKRRGMSAIDEQMQWMMKLYGYTPLLAEREQLKQSVAEDVRRSEAGQKPFEGLPQQGWDHRTLDHDGKCCSYWLFNTPRGRKQIYFDTGVPFTVSEVARQEASCYQYFEEHTKGWWQ